MVIFHSYVKLPEGTGWGPQDRQVSEVASKVAEIYGL